MLPYQNFLWASLNLMQSCIADLVGGVFSVVVQDVLEVVLPDREACLVLLRKSSWESVTPRKRKSTLTGCCMGR